MTDKLKKVLDLLISEDREQASAALNEWFAEQTAAVTSQLLEADKEEELEESKDESEELDEAVTITIDTDGDEASVVEPVVAEDDEEFVADETGDEFGDEEAEDFGGEEVADEVDADAEIAGDDSAVEDLTVDERVEDIEAELEALRAQFAELMGDDADDSEDDDTEEAGDEEVIDGESDEEETEGDDEVEEAIAPGVPGKKTTFVQKSGINKDGNPSIRESDEDFDDLAESADHKLEPVKAEKLKTEGETTGKGAKVKVETNSPVPHKNGAARVGGDPVEIKGKTHSGYARETAPAVAGGKETFKNSQKEPKKISKEGDKSAELNKNKEDKSAKSPINGDPKLRGNDLARK